MKSTRSPGLDLRDGLVDDDEALRARQRRERGAALARIEFRSNVAHRVANEGGADEILGGPAFSEM